MKIIKINTDHYIIVDGSEIKEGDWLLDTTDNTIWDCHKDMPNSLFPECKKITYSTQPLEYIEDKDEFGTHKVQGFDKIRYLPLQEVKELIDEVDVEKMGYNESFRRDVLYNQHSTIGEQNAFIDGTKYGYNQALEDNKEKKYTEEDLRRVFQLGVQHGHGMGYKGLEHENTVIQFLQPKTSWEVEIVDDKLKLK